MAQKVAVVTGSNKGIGFEIVKGLCKRFDGVVYLTSRDKSRGEAAVAELLKLGFKPEFHVLDVVDRFSIEVFRDHVLSKHGGIDILVNNAGVASTENNIYEPYNIATTIININFESVLTIQELLFPLLRDNARVINISSDCGHLSNLRNKLWIERLSNKEVNVDDIKAFVAWFLNNLKSNSYNKEDFADKGLMPAYRVSKIALCLLSFIQQRQVESRGISVNAMHPGLVATDMTKKVGFYTPEQSAATPLYLALDAPSTLKGKYVWFDKRILDWYDYNADYYFKYETLFQKYN